MDDQLTTDQAAIHQPSLARDQRLGGQSPANPLT